MPVKSSPVSKNSKKSKIVAAKAKAAPAPASKLGKIVKKLQGAYMKAKATKPVAKKAAEKPAPKAPVKAAAKPAPAPAKVAAATKKPVAAPEKNLKKAPETPQQAKGKAAAPVAPAKPAAPATKSRAKANAIASKTGLPQTSLRASKGGETAGEAVCREVACEGLSTTAGYCRMHYIKNWKKIKRKELILKEGKLNQYIEELVAKYPDKYIEAIRQDLAEDKSFAKVIYDLDLDEGVDDYDVEGENVDSVIESIKRDFEDDGEGGF